MADTTNDTLAENNPVLYYCLGAIYFFSFVVAAFYVATAAPFL